MNGLIAGLRRKVDRFCTSQLSRKAFNGRSSPFIVSFSFDDFPASAADTAARLLEKRGVTGTYYACLGLVGKCDYGHEFFSREQISRLASVGHEIGCHTFDHSDAWHVRAGQFEDSVFRNAEEYAGYDKSPLLTSFAYPKGLGTLRSKRFLGARFQTVRSTRPGINGANSDANFLLANSIYSDTAPLARQRTLIDEARARDGWLIFYTHDVCDSPSQFGCRPDHFAQVVDLAQYAGAEILTIAAAATRLGIPTP